MSYREDRSVSFFGEESYQNLMTTPRPLTFQKPDCYFGNFFKKIINLCSKDKPSFIPQQEPNSELLSLRTKYKSTMICSTFCSKRTESDGFQEKKHEESFLQCYNNDFPKNEFFILEHNPFNVIAKFHEVNHERVEVLLAQKLTHKPGVGLNFQICTALKNNEFCNMVVVFIIILKFLFKTVKRSKKKINTS